MGVARRIGTIGAVGALPVEAVAQSPGSAVPGWWLVVAAAGLLALVVLIGLAVHLGAQRRRAEHRVRELSALAERLRETQLALHESLERYAIAVRSASDGLWEWELSTGGVHFSPEWKAIVGVEEDEIASGVEGWLALVHPDDQVRVRGELDACLARLPEEGEERPFEVEHRIRRRNGDYRWVLARAVVMRDQEGTPRRVVGTLSDIDERRLTEARLRHSAQHDPLTGLPNRRLFTDLLGRMMERVKHRKSAEQSAERAMERFAVLFVDLDRFKAVNDSLGHAAGDQLLATVAERLTLCLRPGDVIARLGGDEFAVILPDMPDVATAEQVAQRMQDALSQPLALGDHEVFITVSIGIAVYTPDYASAEDLLSHADYAMYRAKAQGKACHAVFDADMRETARARMKLETELRRALERREFEVHYQPVVEILTGEIVGCEALLRWRHPKRGLLNAASFIPLAEQCGLIVPLGQWVLREACAAAAQWRRTHRKAPTVSVNLSTRELLQPGLAELVSVVLRDTALPAQALKLEVTESVFFQEPETAIGVLEQLDGIGVQLHLDDFGTGYSSLSYLHRFPFRTVKIDRYFVSRMTTDDECREIVRSVVKLGGKLGMKVVAEGAEREDQRVMLRRMGCRYLQGNVYWRALNPVELAAALATPPTRSRETPVRGSAHVARGESRPPEHRAAGGPDLTRPRAD